MTLQHLWHGNTGKYAAYETNLELSLLFGVFNLHKNQCAKDHSDLSIYRISPLQTYCFSVAENIVSLLLELACVVLLQVLLLFQTLQWLSSLVWHVWGNQVSVMYYTVLQLSCQIRHRSSTWWNWFEIREYVEFLKTGSCKAYLRSS